MNPMSMMKDADKLSVQQLQQALQNGSLPPYIGVPLLQQKVRDQKRMQAAMQAQQAPQQAPVAQRVIQEAQGLSSLPSNLPTEGYADGGIIAFAERGYVDPDYIDPDYTDTEEAKRLIAEKYTYNPNDTLYNRFKDYLRSTKDTGMKLPGQQAIKQVSSPQKQPAVTPPAAPAPIVDKTAPIKPQIDGADQRTIAERMQLRPAQADRTAPVMGGRPTAPADTRTSYAQATQQPAQQAQPQQQQEEQDLSLSDYMKQYREAAGENKGIGALQNRLSEREARLAKDEDRAPWMALMQAGLATMAGTSPFAMSNIGQGGMAGLQAYTHSMNKLEDAKDKHFEIQAKLEEAQRAEELAAAKYGLESVQADKKAKQVAQLEREKMAAQKAMNDADNAARLQVEQMQVGASKYAVDARNAAYDGTSKPTKMTDQQNYYNRVAEALEADPNLRPDLRLPNGKPNPIAIEAERRKTGTDRRMEGFMGDSMGTSMGSGMMSTQPDPRYRILSQQ
jgi:hypothetical protein